MRDSKTFKGANSINSKGVGHRPRSRREYPVWRRVLVTGTSEYKFVTVRLSTRWLKKPWRNFFNILLGGDEQGATSCPASGRMLLAGFHAVPDTFYQIFVILGQGCVDNAIQAQVNHTNGSPKDAGSHYPGITLTNFPAIYAFLHHVSHGGKRGGTAQGRLIGKEFPVLGMEHVGNDICSCLSVFKQLGNDPVAAFPAAGIFGNDGFNHFLKFFEQMLVEGPGNSLLPAKMIVDGTNTDIGLLLHVVYGHIVKAVVYEKIQGSCQDTAVHRFRRGCGFVQVGHVFVVPPLLRCDHGVLSPISGIGCWVNVS